LGYAEGVWVIMKMTVSVERCFCAGERNAKEEALQIIIIFSVPKGRPDLNTKAKLPSRRRKKEVD